MVSDCLNCRRRHCRGRHCRVHGALKSDNLTCRSRHCRVHGALKSDGLNCSRRHCRVHGALKIDNLITCTRAFFFSDVHVHLFVTSSKAKFGVAEFDSFAVQCSFPIMAGSAGKSIWPLQLSLALFILRLHWPPDLQTTMVRISSAVLNGHDDVNPANVLKPENGKRAVARLKMIEDKDIDAQSARDLRERYPDYTYVDTHVRRIGGVCMFDEIVNKKKEVLAAGKRIPTAWWLAHRQKWAKIHSPEASLVVADSAQPVPAPLVQALTTATSANTRLRSSGPLIGWLGTQSVRAPESEVDLRNIPPQPLPVPDQQAPASGARHHENGFTSERAQGAHS